MISKLFHFYLHPFLHWHLLLTSNTTICHSLFFSVPQQKVKALADTIPVPRRLCVDVISILRPRREGLCEGHAGTFTLLSTSHPLFDSFIYPTQLSFITVSLPSTMSSPIHQKVAIFEPSGDLTSTPPRQGKKDNKSSPTSVIQFDNPTVSTVAAAAKKLVVDQLKGVKEESKYILSLKMALDGSHVDDSNDFREAVPGFQYIPAHLPAKSNESFSFADVLEE